ncbi:hypothetical protein ACSBR1_023629 [Camellia fascicularis]
MEEVSSGFERVGLNEGHNEIEIEKEKSVEGPKVGMLFDSIDDLVQFYQGYVKEKGFGMYIRSSKKVGGEALNSAVKRRLELLAKVGIRMNKSFNSLVVQAGGHEKLTYLEKDCRNYIEKVRRIELGDGDAIAMHNYFLKMQADNSEFFHMMDLDEKG